MSMRRFCHGLFAAAAASTLSACVVAPPVVHTQVRYVQVPAAPPAPAPVTVVDTPPPAVSVYVDPPLVQPAPIAVEFAPPPMLVQVPPPQPFPDAVWIGGYWGWQGRWVWCSGRWAPPPQPGYVWTHPYYENRDGAVVFVAGFWRAPMVAFVPPPPVRLSLEITLAGVTGVRPIGPPGVFVPPPPGSRMGIVVPAPVGTPPAVVMSAPPVVNVGMRVNQTIVNNVTNVTNVTIVAPPSATASGKAFQGTAPAVAHLAAAQPAVVHVAAPPATTTVPTYTAGHAPPSLPPPQVVKAVAPAPARPPTAQAAAMTAAPAPPAHPAAGGGTPAPGSTPATAAARAEEAPHGAAPHHDPRSPEHKAQEEKRLEEKKHEEKKQREQAEREAERRRE